MEVILMSGRRNKMLMADLALFMVALVWGLGFVAMKDGLESFSTLWLTAVRFLLAFAIMLVLFWKKLKHVNMEEIKAGMIIGIFLFLGFVTQTMALNYTTVGKVAFLTTIYVVLVPFILWGLYKKNPGITAFAASLICFAGMGFLSLDSGLSMGRGEILTISCAVFFAFHLISIGHFVKKTDPVVIAAIQIGVVGILSLAGALIFETWPETVTTSSVLSVVFSSVFCTVLAFIIQTAAQKFTPSTHTAIILSLESVFGAIFGIMLMGDPITMRISCGFLLILTSVLITELMPYFKRVSSKGSCPSAAAK